MKTSWGFGTGYSLGPWRRDMMGRIENAAKRATDRASLEMKEKLRQRMRSARLGNLANVVRQTSDQRKRRIKRIGELGFSASGVVFVATKNERTTGALASYLDGPVNITPKGGRRWMAIATKEIPRKAGRFRMTPQRYREGGFESRIGPLQFVPTSKPNVAYLVAQPVSVRPDRAGSARRLPKNGRVRAGRAEVGIVAFVLIRSTRRDRRVDVAALAAEYRNKLPSYLSREMQGGFAKNTKPSMGYGFSMQG